jgi:prepilin-type N-terminal cleavage/methylation domain-containing protein
LEEIEGFTLPEVMITIVLIWIVMAIASSTWFGVVESRAVDSAADQLVSTCGWRTAAPPIASSVTKSS